MFSFRKTFFYYTVSHCFLYRQKVHMPSRLDGTQKQVTLMLSLQLMNNFFPLLFSSRRHLDSKVEWKIIPTSQCSILLHIQSLKKEKKKKTQHNTMILTPNTPLKTIKGKNSLSLSHLKEHNCLSLIQLLQKKERKKTPGILVSSKTRRRGKIVHSSHDHGLVL